MTGWRGEVYDRVAAPQSRWGAEVLDRLDLGGGEGDGALVVDAGCGSGRVTEELLRRWPSASVVALDSSPSMLDQARTRLAPFADRVTFVLADLEGELATEEIAPRPADAVFSTGTFHWVLDHAALYRRLLGLLVPGGCLVAQCGGEGSILAVRRVLDDLGVEWSSMNRYAGARESAAWASDAGFVDVWTWLSDEVVTFGERADLVAYLVDGALAPYLAGRPDEEQRSIVEVVVDRLDEPLLRFVRLNVLARRPA